jgi:AmmeMemoRadiSam system protein A
MWEPDVEHKGRVLLEIAHESVAHAVLGTPETDYDEAWLWEPGATFVTLRHRGELRGCLGTLKAREPLIQDLRQNAHAVVAEDPRFPPLTAEELPETSVEVSLLSPLEEVPCGSEDDAVHLLSRGQDGWVLSYRSHSGTFLPQVWENLPGPRDFLRRLKEKAGLPAAFWDPEIRLYRYTVEKWGSPVRTEGEGAADSC